MYGFRSNAKNDIGPSDVHLRGFFMRKAEGEKPKAEGQGQQAAGGAAHPGAGWRLRAHAAILGQTKPRLLLGNR